MVKLFWLEFTQNIKYGIGKGQREVFKSGDRVIVTAEDKIPLLRHGCKLIAEKDVEFDDVFTKADIKKQAEADKPAPAPKAETPAPAPEPETPAEPEVPEVPAETPTDPEVTEPETPEAPEGDEPTDETVEPEPETPETPDEVTEPAPAPKPTKKGGNKKR